VERILEAGDVAAALGVSIPKVYTLARSGRLAQFAVTRRGVRLFRRAAVDAFRRRSRRGRGRHDLARNGALAGTRR
jgi:excisionase family DNA binding protein